ncbi:MAG TPA: hypothetical protein VMM77_00295 [Gemmatimonadaceae bacterium]|nr:hypothetical protein [Gemmatimonadaceae bacterium]
MRTLCTVPILLLAVFGTACESVTAPDAQQPEALTLAMAHAAPPTAAAGTFTQTGITSLQVRQAGPNTILEQTSSGWVSGTLSGSYTDNIRVVIHPNGRFNAHFTIRCECTMAGEQGNVDLVASDKGELVSPTHATFAGRATITGGTAELSDLRGVLEIEGTVDLLSGLSVYTYSGRIH